MKRVQLIKLLRQIAKERGHSMELTKVNGTLWTFDSSLVTPIPHQDEIEQNTTKGILRKRQEKQVDTGTTLRS